MATTSMNPEDKKKKVEADKPEEQRNQEEKKRQNKKSQTAKDEKNRTKQQPDAKKNAAEEANVKETEELNKQFADEHRIHEIIAGNQGSNETFEKQLNLQKTLNERILNLQKTIEKLGKKPKESKKEKAEKKNMAIGKAVSTGLDSLGNAFNAYSKGNRLL